MKKQVLFTILAMLVSVSAFSHDIEVKNADGVTIYYNYVNDGTELAVTYQGGGYLSYSNEYQGNVVIPASVTYSGKTYPVTSIGYDAFDGCFGLTSVTIPNSVKSIGAGAFLRCSGLTSVTIPNSVTSIGNYAFEGCNSLTSIEIPDSVTSIGNYAFLYCSGLTSVTIPNSVTSIGSGAFGGCSGLTSIEIPNSVTSIGEFAFDGAEIPTVISLIENPFKIYGKTSDDRTFSQNTFNNATLYVPKGTIGKYKATEGWKDFVFIEEGTGRR